MPLQPMDLMSVLFEDTRSHGAGDVAPDTAGANMIFFFTVHISHVAYGKFVAIARERKIPFLYLHGVNMEQIIRQIYESGK